MSYFADLDAWATLYSDCGGNSQSPINIVREDTVEKLDFPAFTFHDNLLNVPEDTTYYTDNNGHNGKHKIKLFFWKKLILSCMLQCAPEVHTISLFKPI